MDCSLPVSSVHGIFQARKLEWVAVSSTWGSSWPRDWTRVSRVVGRHFTVWATREVHILFRFVMTFLPRRKRLLISWLQSPSAVILEPKKIKVSHSFHCFPIYLHEVIGLDAMILVFWMLSFKPVFSLSSFTFIKRLFSSSSLSTISVVSFAYLRLLIFHLPILIPACTSSSQLFSWCILHIS